MHHPPGPFQVAVAAGFTQAQASQIAAAAVHIGLDITHQWQAVALWQVMHGLHQ